MTPTKIVFTGPVGAGKSTAIQAISDISPVITDVLFNVKARAKKPATTLAMDYGVINLSDGEKIHLYGTPGHERFDFMWHILADGGMGLILLLDNTRADPFKDLQLFLESFKKFFAESKVAIGITQMDINSKPTIADYYTQLQVSNLNPPIFAVDAMVKDDISILLQALLYSLDPGIRK